MVKSNTRLFARSPGGQKSNSSVIGAEGQVPAGPCSLLKGRIHDLPLVVAAGIPGLVAKSPPTSL